MLFIIRLILFFSKKFILTGIKQNEENYQTHYQIGTSFVKLQNINIKFAGYRIRIDFDS